MPLTDLTITCEPQQGATYDDLLALAIRAEQLGFGGFFRSDHYLAMDGVDGLPGPTDAWITLAGLARETTRIRIGTLVSSATFRLPGPLAISVAQVDRMSGGRVELGLGTGWWAEEHGAYGIPFPRVDERFDRFEEQLAIVSGLWSTPVGETFSHSGDHYRLINSPALPKPVQQQVPIILGGSGRKRTPALAARYATEFNTPFVPLDAFVAQVDRVRSACAVIGRDPASLIYSAGVVVCIGADEREFVRRAAVTGVDPTDLRQNCIAGTPEEARASLQRWRDAGAQRLHLLPYEHDDLDHIDLIAAALG